MTEALTDIEVKQLRLAGAAKAKDERTGGGRGTPKKSKEEKTEEGRPLRSKESNDRFDKTSEPTRKSKETVEEHRTGRVRNSGGATDRERNSSDFKPSERQKRELPLDFIRVRSKEDAGPDLLAEPKDMKTALRSREDINPQVKDKEEEEKKREEEGMPLHSSRKKKKGKKKKRKREETTGETGTVDPTTDMTTSNFTHGTTGMTTTDMSTGGATTVGGENSSSDLHCEFLRKIRPLLTCISYTIGIGNVLRFTKLAAQHGGSSFLLAYVICLLFLGFPVLYFEFLIGIFTNRSAPGAFRLYAPILEGLGVCMVLLSAIIALYYNVINTWILTYIWKMIAYGIDGKMANDSCKNKWNTQHCISTAFNNACNGSFAVFYNMSCLTRDELATDFHNDVKVPASLEFFKYEVLEQAGSIDDTPKFLTIHSEILIILWVFTCVVIMFCLRVVGSISYINVLLPILSFGAILGVSLSLPQAFDGAAWFLWQLDTSMLAKIGTWATAASQVCFSLSIGTAGPLVFASYHNKQRNCYKDAIIIVIVDLFFTLCGGVAVFAVVGNLAFQQGKPVKQFVMEEDRGWALPFMALSSAASHIEYSWPLSVFFFLTLLIMGLTCQIGAVGVSVTWLQDVLPKFLCAGRIRTSRFVAPTVCMLLLVLGLELTTSTGVFWLNLIDVYVVDVGILFAITMEVAAISFLYGGKHFVRDISEMYGRTQSLCCNIFGKTGILIYAVILLLVPIVGLASFAMTIVHLVQTKSYAGQTYPPWSIYLAWVFAAIAPLMILVALPLNIKKLAREHQSLSHLFKVHILHPSYARIAGAIE